MPIEGDGFEPVDHEIDRGLSDGFVGDLLLAAFVGYGNAFGAGTRRASGHGAIGQGALGVLFVLGPVFAMGSLFDFPEEVDARLAPSADGPGRNRRRKGNRDARRVAGRRRMRGRTRTAGGLAMAVLLAASSGCATLLRPFPTQRVRVESLPPGARVFIDGEDAGVTPMVAALSRRQAEYGLRLEKDGCLPEDYSLRRSTSPLVILTALQAAGAGVGAVIERTPQAWLAPAVVILVDWFSGAMFSLPRAVRVPLRADADEGWGPAGQASGECRGDTPATAGRGSRPLSVPLDAVRILAPRRRLAVDAELRARLRAVSQGSPRRLAASQPGAR